MNYFQKEIKDEIMATDLFICLTDEVESESKIKNAVDEAFEIFREFEKRFSRFKTNNELSSFNDGSKNIKLSDDLFWMLEKSIYYRNYTKGAFDICILPDLLNEGYNVSKKEGFYKKNDVRSPRTPCKITDLLLNEQNKIASKPKELRIDLGGIAKGYVIDKVADFLRKNYQNFIIDAGGDMFASGKDLINNYSYWAIGVENPFEANKLIDTLNITNKGVATSGINRRRWMKDGKTKNHIIDPVTGKSISNNIMSVTVVADLASEADVLAKSLLVMGMREATKFSENNSVAAYFIDKKLEVYKSSKMNEYVFQK